MSTQAFKGSHLIAGQWQPSAADGWFKIANPATGKEFDQPFAVAAAPEVDAAMSAAAGAFEQAKDLPPKWSADLLDAIAGAIMDLGDALLDRGEQETALPRARLTGERTRTYNQLKLFAEVVREGSWVDATIDTADPERKPAAKPDLRRMLIGRGPVVVFGASNFPFAFGVCGGDTASAFAAGCAVVTKGHPSHPGVNELFASAVLSAIQSCKLPLGLFSLLQGKSHDLGGLLAKHPGTTAIGFTGSLRGGRALFDIAAKRPRPIPVYAEMGSLNPLVILPGAMAEKSDAIAQGLAGSVLLGLGQFCTKPGLVFTVGENAEKFLPALAAAMAASSAGAMLNKTLRDSFCTRAGEFAQVQGVKTLVNGSPSDHATMGPSLWETTADIWINNRALHEEAFGPGALVIRCKNEDEVMQCLGQVQGSLTGTVHAGAGDDRQLVARILRKLETLSGRVIVNGYPTGVEVGHAIVHGGPYPATTDPGWTSVGSASIRRWVRMIAYQDLPDGLLPAALQNANPLKIQRMVNGTRTDQTISAS
jgi:NADP-dependent aldehyde dehydrogenase